jgi:hypothetical protein
LDDFAVTGTSLLYCDAAQFSWRCHEIIGFVLERRARTLPHSRGRVGAEATFS